MKKILAAAAALAVMQAVAAPEAEQLGRKPIAGVDPAPAAQVQTQAQAQAAKADAQPADVVEQPRVPASVLSVMGGKRVKNVQAEKAIEKLADPAASGATTRIALNKNTTIGLKPGENVFIPIARSHINRILTPFKNPKVFSSSLSTGAKGECGELCIRNGVIYVTTDAKSAVSAFITEEGHEEIAFSVTMIPQSIPPREVHFKFPESVMAELDLAGNVASADEAERWETALPYQDMLVQSFRSIALGGIPQGYSLRKTNRRDTMPVCRQQGLKFSFMPGQVLEGFHMNFFVGTIENVSDRPVEFQEMSCGAWNTAAVTSWPLKVLRPGQKTEVYVALKRSEQAAPEQKRRPLITREYQ